MQIPGAYIVTVLSPQLYSERQLDLACQVAHMLNRGKLVLAVEPENR